MPELNWNLIDEMVSELGDLYALEVEASNFPEIAETPAVLAVRLAVLRATDALSRIGPRASAPAVAQAREALASAGSSVSAARRLVSDARASRNRRV